MKHYYFDLNTPAHQPVCLHTSSFDVEWVDDWRAHDFAAALAREHSQPVEKLLYDLVHEAPARLYQQIEKVKTEDTLSPDLLYRLRYLFDRQIVKFLSVILAKGIVGPEDLKKQLDNLKYDLYELAVGDTEVLAAMIDPAEIAAVQTVLEKLDARAPAAEIIDYIDQKQLNRYFSPETEELSVAEFNPKIIRELCSTELPAKYRFSEFLREVINAYVKNLDKHVENIENTNAYVPKELYAQYPGVQLGRGWAHLPELKLVDLGEKVSARRIKTALGKDVGVVIRSAEKNRDFLAVRNRELIHTLAPEKIIAPSPLTVDLDQIYSAETPKENLAIFLELFDNYFQPELETAVTSKKDLKAGCVLLLLCLESYEKIYDYRSEAAVQQLEKDINDPPMIEAAQAARGYLLEIAQKIPKNIEVEMDLDRLRERWKQNFEKTQRLNQLLQEELAAENDTSRQSSEKSLRSISQLESLTKERGMLAGQIKTQEKAYQRTVAGKIRE